LLLAQAEGGRRVHKEVLSLHLQPASDSLLNRELTAALVQV
jgi:hypothetical protein